MDNRGKAELIFVLAMMAFLFIFAIAAVVIFVRVWRKEHKDKTKPT